MSTCKENGAERHYCVECVYCDPDVSSKTACFRSIEPITRDTFPPDMTIACMHFRALRGDAE